MTNIEQLYSAYLQSRRVTTDSRAITPGCIFFAFKGEHFDGNAFIPQAMEQGAAMCVGGDEALQTLQALAREHRRHLQIPVIGITGTNGKTTTKELVHAVLSKRYKTSATKGNFNNHLGVPLTLLNIPADAELAIVEMGANHPGEIAFLCEIADPDCGLITNVGRAHLEGFGSFEGVIHTKTELYRHLASKHGLAFVNADNAILIEQAERLATVPDCESMIPAYAPGYPMLMPELVEQTPLSIVTYGRESDADVRGTLVGSDPYMRFYFERGDQVYNVHTHLLGNYNFDNCMAAVAVGLQFGVDPFNIKEAIEGYTPTNQRSEYKETSRGNRLYLDCYNANPSSMAAAIESFKMMGGTVAIIGGMHELGADEHKEHQQLITLLDDCALQECILIGPEFDGIVLPNTMRRFDDTEAVAQWLQTHSIERSTILIKGSNTNRLWTLEQYL